MRKIIFICFTICFLAGFVFAQTKPFEVFGKAVKEEKAGYSGNKENLSTIFNQERIRLGENFETELWKYLGNDVEKHYWIGFFLKSKSYLHGSQPLPELTFKVWQNGIKLTRNNNDEKNLNKRFGLLILSAVQAENLKRSDLALIYKAEADSLADVNVELRNYFPTMSEFERCIYQNIGSDTSLCKQEADASQIPKDIVISAGIMNSRAISEPTPKYPEEAEKNNISGRVHVKVLIDIDGSVISAEAISGPIQFYKVSEEAALKAKFSPTKLSGKPVKVSGVIIYTFAKKYSQI